MTRIGRMVALAGAAVLCGSLVLGVASAGAAVGYKNLCPSLGTAFCEPDEFAIYFGHALAVDNSGRSSEGDVWFESGWRLSGNSLPNALVKLDASGNKLVEVGESGIPGSAAQIFAGNSYALSTAVDPTSGDVYLSTELPLSEDKEVGYVTKFDSSGAFQFQISGSGTPQHSFRPVAVAVDASGDFYVADGEHGVIDKFTSSGEYREQIPIAPGLEGNSLAIGPEGNLYVAGKSKTGGTISEYSPTGAPVDCADGSNVLNVESVGGTFTEMVTVDPSDGHLFVGARNEAESYFVAEYSSLCASAPSARLGAHEFGNLGWGEGIAVNGSTHTVYVSHWQQGYLLIAGQVTIPDVTTSAPPTGITRTTTTVSGTVNPDGTEVTGCEVEYGTTAAYGHSEPCSQTLPLTGTSPTAVSAELHFTLPPTSLVYYRVKAVNENGANYGEDHTFYTEALLPPVVEARPASNVSQFAATLNATIKTGEALVNYRFEYGTSTAYGQIEPIPDGLTPVTLEPVEVSQAIQGLQAGTTYHYRLTASSPGATEVHGPDGTFTTLPVPTPTVETGAANEVGVGQATVGGAVDPHGWDTTYLFEYGPTTGYGSSWPTVLVDMGALEGPQPVLVSIPNLQPNTTYHYRLVASNGGGSSYGQDMTFTTGEYPAPAVQEPPTLGTLLVPALGEKAKAPAKKGKKTKKAKKKTKKHPKSKRRARRKKR
jgi:hypothetical protein